MSNPFASATAGAGSADPFGTKPSEVKASDYPGMDELDGQLLVIQPTKLEKVAKPAQFGGKPGETQDRITADVTVINRANPAASTTHKDMFLSQGALVGQLKGFIETRGLLLGTLRRHRAKGTPEGYNTPDEVDAMIQQWVAAGARGNKPQFAWKLADWTDADKDAAMAWYTSKTQG